MKVVFDEEATDSDRNLEAGWRGNTFLDPSIRLATITKERDHLRAALQRLVDAKGEKDANGDTPRYRELKAGAWEEAREILRRMPRGG